MAIYQGVGGVNREIKQIFEGVGGVNREIKERWEGVGGVNQQVFGTAKTMFDFTKGLDGFTQTLGTVVVDTTHGIRAASYSGVSMFGGGRVGCDIEYIYDRPITLLGDFEINLQINFDTTLTSIILDVMGIRFSNAETMVFETGIRDSWAGTTEVNIKSYPNNYESSPKYDANLRGAIIIKRVGNNLQMVAKPIASGGREYGDIVVNSTVFVFNKIAICVSGMSPGYKPSTNNWVKSLTITGGI